MVSISDRRENFVSTNNYRVAWCPICNQGWVEIVKNRKSGLLYLCCDECKAEWTNPEEIGVLGKGS